MLAPLAPHGSRGEGNTRPPPRVAASVRWCFTLNNYTEECEKTLLARLAPHKFIYGHEVGESGTPHLQGYVEFNKKLRPVETIAMPAIHWEKAKGDRGSNITYCSKDNNNVVCSGFRFEKPLKLISVLYDWQAEIVDMIKKDPDDRSIYWYWEDVGNVGKSALVKLLCAKHDALICGGKASDMKYLICEYKNAQGVYPELIIFDVPRSNLDYVSYTGIEEIKNGCFASSKYECKTVIMNSPHVLIFANEEPIYSKMSIDRWKVKKITPSGERSRLGPVGPTLPLRLNPLRWAAPPLRSALAAPRFRLARSLAAPFF
jgi:hypothetical protein